MSLSSGHVSLGNGPLSCSLCVVLPEKLGRSSQFSFDSLKSCHRKSAVLRGRKIVLSFPVSQREKRAAEWDAAEEEGRYEKRFFIKKWRWHLHWKHTAGDVFTGTRGRGQQRLFVSCGYYSISQRGDEGVSLNTFSETMNDMANAGRVTCLIPTDSSVSTPLWAQWSHEVKWPTNRVSLFTHPTQSAGSISCLVKDCVRRCSTL